MSIKQRLSAKRIESESEYMRHAINAFEVRTAKRIRKYTDERLARCIRAMHGETTKIMKGLR